MSFRARHQQLVDAAELTGLTQCKGALWKDSKGMVLMFQPSSVAQLSSCNELGLLYWGEMTGVITTTERIELYEQLIRRVGSLFDANDAGMTWQQFTELLP